MSGFVSPLWVLGVCNANPRVSRDADLIVAGVAGPALALPSLVGDNVPLTALPVRTGNDLAFAALPTLSGSSAMRSAIPVSTGVVYG